MQTTTIRQKLHLFIDSIEDKKAEAIYALFDDEIDPDALRRKLVQIERERYLRGEDKSYSWEEVRKMAINRENRNAV